jgi:hypothetical protein
LRQPLLPHVFQIFIEGLVFVDKGWFKDGKGLVLKDERQPEVVERCLLMF